VEIGYIGTDEGGIAYFLMTHAVKALHGREMFPENISLFL
jgi:hypothetical protein